MRIRVIKYFLTLLFALSLLTATAQTVTKTRTFTPDEHTVVRDSAGKILPYSVWMKMMSTRAYTLRPVDPTAEKWEFTLLKRPGGANGGNVTTYAYQIGPTGNSNKPSAPFKHRTPDQNSVVKDSSGMVYPYAVWQNLWRSGKYMLNQPISDSSFFILKPATIQQREQMMANRPLPAQSESFPVGDLFRPFKEKDMNGEKIDLKLYAGKVIVLNFWFIGCPPCRQEIPELNELGLKYKDNKDVVFVAVSLDRYDEIKDYISKQPWSYHIIDDGRFVASRYNVKLYPTNVVINRDGKVVFSSVGYSNSVPYYIEKNILSALATPVSTTAAK